MEREVSEVISCQVEIWKQTDICYQRAVLADDSEKMLGLENCFVTWREKRCLCVWFIFEALQLSYPEIYSNIALKTKLDILRERTAPT